MKIDAPEMRGVWLMALALTVVGFIVYYAVAYESLIAIYRTHGYFAPLTSGPENLEIKIAIPRYAAHFERRPILVRIINTGDYPVHNVHFTAALEWPQDGDIDSVSIAPEYQFNSSLTFKEIQPHAMVLGELNLPLLGVVPTFWLNETELSGSEFLQAPVNDPARAFLLASIQRVLLPPWSNGFLVSLAVAIAWLWQGQLGRHSRPATVVRYTLMVLSTAGVCVGVLMALLGLLEPDFFWWGLALVLIGVVFIGTYMREPITHWWKQSDGGKADRPMPSDSSSVSDSSMDTRPAAAPSSASASVPPASPSYLAPTHEALASTAARDNVAPNVPPAADALRGAISDPQKGGQTA